MKNDLNFSETKALRLLKLCASPGKTANPSQFRGMQDASGNSYMMLLSDLKEKGMITYNANTIEIL